MGTAQALKKQNIKSGASKSVNRCSDPNICCSGGNVNSKCEKNIKIF